MKIIAVRHGETEGNVQHLVQSRTHGKLTETGIAQAAAAAEALRRVQIDAVYTSDLQRAVDTALILAEHHDEAELHFDSTLRERDHGRYEGSHWEDIPNEFFEGTNLDNPMPDGESWYDVHRRIGRWLNDLYRIHPDDTVLLVTHGGPVKAMRTLLTGMTLRQSVDEPVPNGSVWRWEMIGLINDQPESV